FKLMSRTRRRPVGSRFFDGAYCPPPRRKDCPSFSFSDIDRCVMIAIDDQAAIRASIDSNLERHSMLTTTTRASRRCARRIHHFNTAPSFFRFVNSDQDELRPSGVRNALCKMVVSHQVFDLQVFEFDETEAIDQFFRFLEMMISSLPGNGLMFLRQQANRLLSPPAALVTTRNPSLCLLQRRFRFSIVLGTLDQFVIGQMCERLDADINPDRYIWREDHGLVFDFFDREDHIPAIGFALDRTGLDRSFDRTRQKHRDLADLRQMQPVCLLIQLEAALLISERVVSRTRAKARKTRNLTFLDATKEMLKC